MSSASAACCRTVAETVLNRHVQLHSLNHYAGLVTLQGLVQLAVVTGDPALRERSRELLRPFHCGEVRKVGGVYDKMYRCGGNATAWLVQAGYAPEALQVVIDHADELMATHPRDPNGIFGKLEQPEKIWIDSAFAVCPFLTITGNLTGQNKYYDEACHQMIAMHELLLDRNNGLYHQSLNFAGPGRLSEDHWSRGNGWAALALADLAAELPADAPQREKIIAMYRAHMSACLRFQNEQGLWHQEITAPDAYVETSGSGLILYALGRGLNNGLLDEPFRSAFLKGLRGYLTYIAVDGSVFNTCVGCLCPGNGSIAAYQAHPWRLNDEHAFGPALLTLTQALKLGIREVRF